MDMNMTQERPDTISPGIERHGRSGLEENQENERVSLLLYRKR